MSTSRGTGSRPNVLWVRRVRIAVTTSIRRRRYRELRHHPSRGSDRERTPGPSGVWFNASVAPVIEEVGENRVRLTVDVPAHAVHHAVEHAASDLAASTKIPGFRNGKVPIQVLLARIGKERLYTEAVESHIGNWFWNAAASTRVRPIESPDYEYELPASDREDWRFSATFAVQPKPELPDWTQLEVGSVEPDVPPAEVDGELAELQAMVAELAPVEDRPAQPGDVVVLDLVEDGTGQAQRDYVVELGVGRLVPEIEEAIVGLGAGESRDLEFQRNDGSGRKVSVLAKQILQ